MTAVHVLTNLDTGAPRRASRIERRRLRLSTLVRRQGLDPRREVLLARRNGHWVRQRDWHKTLAGKNDVVMIVVMPAGGGNVWRTVASLALVVVAAFAAPYLAPYLVAGFGGVGVTLSTATATLLAGGALAIAGNYALNALLPVSSTTPGLGTSLSESDLQAPTYAFSISSQQNLSRLGGAKPEWFGYHRVVPDLAATAWWEYSDGRQTLYQTLALTKGEVAIDKIELGRSSIDVFEDIDHEVFGPDDPPDLFEPEVYQSTDVRSITLAAPNDLTVGDDGIYGPFAALPPGQTGTRFGVDIAFSRGLYYTNDDGSLTPKTVQWKIEARSIDDAGAPIGDWFDVATETFDGTPAAANTSTPASGVLGQFMGGGFATTDKLNSQLVVSYRYTLSSAIRPEFRLRRLDTKDLAARAGHEVVWAGLRGFLGFVGYGDMTILQLAITATASVNDQTVRQVAVTGTRKLPVYDAESGTWSAPQATRSIAAAVAHVIRSENGGNQPDSRFDLDALAALDAVWTERGDTFDYYASAQRPLWEMLQTILRCGRALPYRQANMVRFWRDAPQTMPATGFSRENIVQRSLKINYRLPEPGDDVDGFELRYFDRRTWNFNTLRKRLDTTPGNPLRPIRRSLDGCVEVTQALRELDYYVADYNLRPIGLEFDTEMEGFLPSYGDLTLVQHDSPRWGLSNRVISWTSATRTLGLMAPPIWTFGEGWYARVRDVRGRFSAQVLVDAAPTSTTIMLHAVPVYDDGSPFDFTLSDSELLHVVLGQATDAPRLALFRDMTPREGGRRCSVRLVLEDPAVHVN